MAGDIVMLNLMETIFFMSINGSILVILILLTKTILKDKLNVKFHYFIWFLLIIKLTIPYELQSNLSIFNISNILIEKQRIINTPLKTICKNDINYKDIDNGESIKNSNNKLNYKSILLFIWIFGILCSITFTLHGTKKIKIIKKLSDTNYISNFNEVLNNCMKTMNIKKKFTLMYTDYAISPCLEGIIHPIILISRKTAESISSQELKYIIMHELCHFKKLDIVINWIIIILNTIYWFNPIIRYGFYKMKQDCEISCDSDVLKYLNDAENIHYGNTIIKILEINTNYNTLLGTTSMIKDKSEIKKRITLILKYKKVSLKSIILGILAITLIGSTGLTKASNLKTEGNLNSIPVSEVNSSATFDKNLWNTTFELWDGKDFYKINTNKKSYSINVTSDTKFGTVNIKIYNDKKVLFEKCNPKNEIINIPEEDTENVKIETTGKLTKGSYTIRVDNGQKIKPIVMKDA
ncbi:hypothetical protein B9W14_07040 [Clostridium drakei]|uniref:Peptidase M56 domain-containing protein n=2 Tax=Clostridium drakei TaxID=332101 RepID=A0A2U8DPW0_9CLOT|nr:hypothetical protein B9W14_07040 [Clostridium drakei]